MQTNYSIPILLFLVFSFVLAANGQPPITAGSLISEMADLERLAMFSKFRSVQYSSYDRRSVSPDKPFWFANSDGFGREPIPAFEKVLKEPDNNGIGEYLICDVKEPGAIVRLWTAEIAGSIRMYLDGKQVYSGAADKFFWNFPAEVGNMEDIELKGPFRQFDALYFPIPFAKSCRIEWIGNLKNVHFYHVGVRLYDKNIKIKTFHPDDLVTFKKEIVQTAKVLANPDAVIPSGETKKFSNLILKGSKQEILRIDGGRAIEQLKIKINTSNPEIILRQTVLRIFFDDASIPQVESPVGDFFGAVPGINPYVSLPFSVETDATMTCRFVMPFAKSATIQIENMSEQNITVETSVSTRPYTWNKDNSLYFRAHWRINHGLKSSGQDVVDLPYLLAMGKGNIVGAACYLMNPSNVPSAHGNWWGEGDEKIFVDNDRFPSFFGTGSEDYYNYSWSSSDIFYYPYCGQPRNDGTDTRGFITNFRWHIIDNIPYINKAAFYMELLSHGDVPDFIYARMIYHYAKEGLLDDHSPITIDDVRPMKMPIWNPMPYKGSLDYRFISAEIAFRGIADTNFEYDPIWAEGKIFVWKPKKTGEKIDFEMNTSEGKKDMKISFGHMPDGGKIKVYINDILVKFGNNGILDLHDGYRTLNRTYSTGEVEFVKGKNIITFENHSEGTDAKIAVDFFWVKD